MISPSSPFSRPPYQLSFPVQICTSSYSLCLPQPWAPRISTRQVPDLRRARKAQMEPFSKNLLNINAKKVKVELSEIRAVGGSREVSCSGSCSPYLGCPWVTGWLQLLQAALSTSPPCNCQRLSRSPGEVICALQLLKSKENTRSKTPPGPQSTVVLRRIRNEGGWGTGGRTSKKPHRK